MASETYTSGEHTNGAFGLDCHLARTNALAYLWEVNAIKLECLSLASPCGLV